MTRDIYARVASYDDAVMRGPGAGWASLSSLERPGPGCSVLITSEGPSVLLILTLKLHLCRLLSIARIVRILESVMMQKKVFNCGINISS